MVPSNMVVGHVLQEAFSYISYGVHQFSEKDNQVIPRSSPSSLERSEAHIPDFTNEP